MSDYRHTLPDELVAFLMDAEVHSYHPILEEVSAPTKRRDDVLRIATTPNPPAGDAYATPEELRVYAHLNPIGGIRVIEDERMVMEQFRYVRRTWPERLFTRPWRPWLGSRLKVAMVPMVITDFEGNLRIHPELMGKFREQIAERMNFVSEQEFHDAMYGKFTTDDR